MGDLVRLGMSPYRFLAEQKLKQQQRAVNAAKALQPPKGPDETAIILRELRKRQQDAQLGASRTTGRAFGQPPYQPIVPYGAKTKLGQ